jgi:hypothetical protein
MASLLSEEQAEKNTSTLEALLKTFEGIRQERVAKMFDAIGLVYCTAPASSREDYHGCYAGGLLDHSLRVTKNLLVLTDALQKGKYTKIQLVFLGLMHDLGKVGDPPVELYLPNPSDWHRGKGMLYESNKKLPYMPICDRTLYLLQKYEISLSAEEYTALRISDGPYEKSNEKYGMKEPDLAVLLHFADRWACSQEKTPADN